MIFILVLSNISFINNQKYNTNNIKNNKKLKKYII